MIVKLGLFGKEPAGVGRVKREGDGYEYDEVLYIKTGKKWGRRL
jgi:hypothetical protein